MIPRVKNKRFMTQGHLSANSYNINNIIKGCIDDGIKHYKTHHNIQIKSIRTLMMSPYGHYYNQGFFLEYIDFDEEEEIKVLKTNNYDILRRNKNSVEIKMVMQLDEVIQSITFLF